MSEKDTNKMEDDTERFAGIDLDSHFDEHDSRPPWRALLYFTSVSHIAPFALALFFSISAGFIIPIMSIYTGKIFDRFSDFGAGHLTGREFVSKVYIDSMALCVLGGASGALNGAFYTTWLVFGELQARTSRERLFNGLLEKELEWYDMRISGAGALISRLQRSAITKIFSVPADTRQPDQRSPASNLTAARIRYTVNCDCIGCSDDSVLLFMEFNTRHSCCCTFLGHCTGLDLGQHAACYRCT